MKNRNTAAVKIRNEAQSHLTMRFVRMRLLSEGVRGLTSCILSVSSIMMLIFCAKLIVFVDIHNNNIKQSAYDPLILWQ